MPASLLSQIISPSFFHLGGIATSLLLCFILFYEIRAPWKMLLPFPLNILMLILLHLCKIFYNKLKDQKMCSKIVLDTF